MSEIWGMDQMACSLSTLKFCDSTLLLKSIQGLERWSPNVRNGYLGVIGFLF